MERCEKPMLIFKIKCPFEVISLCSLVISKSAITAAERKKKKVIITYFVVKFFSYIRFFFPLSDIFCISIIFIIHHYKMKTPFPLSQRALLAHKCGAIPVPHLGTFTPNIRYQNKYGTPKIFTG